MKTDIFDNVRIERDSMFRIITIHFLNNDGNVHGQRRFNAVRNSYK